MDSTAVFKHHVVITGVNHDDLVKLAGTHFNSLPSSTSSLPTLQPCRYTGSEMRFRNDDMPFAHIVLAIEVSKVLIHESKKGFFLNSHSVCTHMHVHTNITTQASVDH